MRAATNVTAPCCRRDLVDVHVVIILFLLTLSSWFPNVEGFKPNPISYRPTNLNYSPRGLTLLHALEDGTAAAAPTPLNPSPTSHHQQLQQPPKRWKEKGRGREKEPLLDAKLIEDVILSWTRPLPPEYLQQPLVLVGPSGVGKNRLVKALLKDYSKFFAKVVTHTTRGPRVDEVNGTTYNYVSRDTFESLVQQGDYFLEHSTVHNNYYGLSLEAYKQVCGEGKIAIFEVDVQGAQKLRASLARQFDLSPHYLFIAPASLESLRERLLVRATESPEEMSLRLNNAVGEIEASSTPGLFDKVLVNDDLEETSRALFNTCRYWYPFLPSASRLRMLQRRVAKVKAMALAGGDKRGGSGTDSDTGKD